MYIKLLALIFTLHYALGQDLQPKPEEELNGDGKYLNMSSRGLEETLDLDSMSKLEVMDFSNNAIAHLEWRRIENAPNLKVLDLSGNADLALPELGASVDLPLTVLNMSNCNVELISKTALSGLKNLEVLDLRGNPIAFEKSQVFETLETPPKLLIISKITKHELISVCKQVDMKIQVVDDDMIFECKDVRRDNPAQSVISKNREKITRDVLIDEMLLTDTHMELQEERMLNEEPFGEEGSGNSSLEQKSSEEPEETEDTDNTLDETSEKTPSEKPHIEEEVVSSSSVSSEAPENTSEEETLDKILPDVNESVEDKGKSEIISKIIVPDLNHKSNENHEHHDHHETMSSENNEKSQIQAKQPMHKSTIVNVNPDPPQQADVGENKSSESSASTGKNIILVLVIGAAIMGSVFGLMKVYKDRKRNAANNSSTEGREMKEMPERKPLIAENTGAVNGQPKQCDEQNCIEVVVDGQGDKNPPPEMTTKEILNNPGGLPDIDDPSRLSTIIVSSPNLNEDQ